MSKLLVIGECITIKINRALLLIFWKKKSNKNWVWQEERSLVLKVEVLYMFLDISLELLIGRHK